MAELPKLVGLGAGGHAKVVIEILRAMGASEISGLLDSNPSLWGKELLGVKVLGHDDMLEELFVRGLRNVFIGVGSTGESRNRKELFAKARAHGFTIVSCIHPNSLMSPSAKFAEGLQVMAGATINAAVQIGENVIVNTGAIVEHDCQLEPHTHIAPGVQMGSAVIVGAGSHVGIGATVRQGIRIGRNSVVGAGAVVVDDVPDNTVVVGVPARPMRKTKI